MFGDGAIHRPVSSKRAVRRHPRAFTIRVAADPPSSLSIGRTADHPVPDREVKPTNDCSRANVPLDRAPPAVGAVEDDDPHPAFAQARMQ